MKNAAPFWRRFGGWGILGMAVAAMILLLLRNPPIEVDGASVERKEFIETLISDGILRSKTRITVTAFAMGELGRMPYRVGDELKKGAVIAELLWDVKPEPVRAPIAGVISKVYRESAGPILRGEPIVEMVDPRHLEGIAEVLTIHASLVRPGNPAFITIPGMPEPIRARVIRISKAGFVKISALGVEEERTEVTLALEHPARELVQHLGSTYHVEVAIETRRTPNAVLVPTGALIRDGSDWAVYRVKEGRARKERVEIAGTSGGSAKLAGDAQIKPGDRVIVYPGDLVKDGIRVKERDSR